VYARCTPCAETARLVEADVRENGATPATIAVINGTLHIGLDDDQLENLGQATNVAKLSRADMAACIATGGTGATTVAATMIGAELAGIHVFATGGIGGVHKGAEQSFDISADLHELALTPVTVVAAGAKAPRCLAGVLVCHVRFGGTLADEYRRRDRAGAGDADSDGLARRAASWAACLQPDPQRRRDPRRGARARDRAGPFRG